MRPFSLTAGGVWAYNLTIYAQKRHSLDKTTPTQENRLKTANKALQIARKNRARTDKGQVQTIRPETTEILRPFPKSNTIEQIVKSGKNRGRISEEKIFGFSAGFGQGVPGIEIFTLKFFEKFFRKFKSL